MIYLDILMKKCGFITSRSAPTFYIGPFKAPKIDIFFAPTQRARLGSIGKLINIEWIKREGYEDWRFMLYFEDKKKKLWFDGYQINEVNHVGPTKYVWTPRPKLVKKTQDDFPVLKNRYGQELTKGTFVMGVTNTHHELFVGNITRWNERTVWGMPHGCFGSIPNRVGKQVDVPLNWYYCAVVNHEEQLKDELLTTMLSLEG